MDIIYLKYIKIQKIKEEGNIIQQNLLEHIQKHAFNYTFSFLYIYICIHTYIKKMYTVLLIAGTIFNQLSGSRNSSKTLLFK
jgi:hypothetical protein